MPVNIYLIPLPLFPGNLASLPADVWTYTRTLSHYIVENIRTARRFLRELHPDLPIDPIQWCEIDHKKEEEALSTLKKWVAEGHSIGIMSEAGCPAIADPGSIIVAAAHKLQCQIVPLSGPSALLMALMASGLNGQSFAFAGYLPVKEPALQQRIKELETLSLKYNQTQMCIETPYRTQALAQALCRHLQPGTLLCIAQNISAPNALITTKAVQQWQTNPPQLDKLPTVFLWLKA